MMFPCRLHPHAKLLERPAHLDGAAVPEQFFDLAQDHRHRIGGKADAAVFVEVIAGFDKTHASGTVQIIVFHAAPTEAPRAGVYQSKVLFNKCVPPGLIGYHASARLSCLCIIPAGPDA